jgi:hypothetical protein
VTPPTPGFPDTAFLAGLLITAIETGQERWQDINGLFGVRPALADLLRALRTRHGHTTTCEAIDAIADPAHHYHHYYFHHLLDSYTQLIDEPGNPNPYIAAARASKGK